ncbi:MAG TPA: tRNA (adenosine(37)-N6)-dimethylallyltransferase MiaA [Gemmataceae bacterium]|jgi:tRNA dimethylallyltransferase|nr:tRNA (adenosine(37)-N6)-dimethylallyltransferase MiaA [Gemmataceae bacterium]
MNAAHPFRRSWILSGPTGSGKTEFALRLAEQANAEIVAMDSMTLYHGMDIGTAKPSAEDRQRVPHHLLDVLEPWESASVAWWLERAAECCREIESRGKRALFVGGTPLYLKALLFGLFAGPSANAELRQRLEEEAKRVGVPELHRRLARVDPIAASRLHPNDLRRIVRALEVWELTGKPISDFQEQWRQDSHSELRSHCWWLNRPRAELVARISARVEKMIEAGWIDEARRLRELRKPLSRQAFQALGYQQIFDYLDGQRDLKATIELIQTRSRQFAKRQLTWFRSLPQCRPIPVSGDALEVKLIE